jgi:NAD(P)-dependent dehydrogenase (short-subunit alcohol dehydrogenase family)
VESVSRTARLLAMAGASVVLADLPGTALAEAAASVVEVGEAAHHVVDISDEETVERLIAKVGGYPDEYVAAFEQARHAIDEIIAEREENPTDDFIGGLVAGRERGEPISDD